MRNVFLALLLSSLSHGQTVPYSFKTTPDGKVDPTALQEDFEYQAAQTKKNTAALANLTVTGVVTSVGAASPLCSSGGALPNITFCGTLAESQVTNLVSDLASKLSLTAQASYAAAVAASTAAAFSAINSTGSAVTVETARALAAETVLSNSTATIKHCNGVPWYDITCPQFGAVADGTAGNPPGTDNGPVFRKAIAVATNSINNVGNSNGGVVYVPPGVFYIGISTIVVPAGVRIQGDNTQTSTLYSSGTVYAFQLGNTAGTLSGGMGVSNLTLDLLTSKSNGILLYGAAYAKIDNVVIGGGAVYNPSSVTCIGIDGANISAFGNSINNVTCIHAHAGIRCATSGSTDATAQYISNFYFEGDDGSFPGNGSVGIDIGAGVASDCESTQIYGGDLEQTTTGIILRAGGSGPIEVYGTRFEQNVGHGEANVVLAADANPSTFVGLVGVAASTSGIDDLATISSHTFLGNVDQSAFPRPSLVQSLTVNASMTPMNVLLDATHQWQYTNSAQGFGNEFLVTEGWNGARAFILAQQVTQANMPLDLNPTGGEVAVNGSTFVVHGGQVGVGTGYTGFSQSALTVDQDNGTAWGGIGQVYLNSAVSGHRAELRLTDSLLSNGWVSYLPSATATIKHLSMSAGNAEADLVVRGDGNVGVSTANPVTTLDVNGTAQLGTGATKSTFTAVGGLFIAAGSSITTSGAKGFITSASSITASAFFGDGSNLSGINASVSVAFSSADIGSNTISQTSFASCVKLSTRTWTSSGKIARIQLDASASPSGSITNSLYVNVYLDGAPGTGTAIATTKEYDWLSTQTGFIQDVTLNFTYRPTAGSHTICLALHTDSPQVVTFCPGTGGNCEFSVTEF